MKDREYGNTFGEIQNWFSREVQLYNLSEINPFSINDLIYTCPFNDDIFKHYCPEVVSIVQTRAQSILHDATKHYRRTQGHRQDYTELKITGSSG